MVVVVGGILWNSPKEIHVSRFKLKKMRKKTNITKLVQWIYICKKTLTLGSIKKMAKNHLQCFIQISTDVIFVDREIFSKWLKTFSNLKPWNLIKQKFQKEVLLLLRFIKNNKFETSSSSNYWQDGITVPISVEILWISTFLTRKKPSKSSQFCYFPETSKKYIHCENKKKHISKKKLCS